MYRLATKCTTKTSRRKPEREFFYDHVRVLVYSDYLLLTRRGLSSSRLSGFSECVHKRKSAIRFFRSSRL